jgi:hypothetical protein
MVVLSTELQQFKRVMFVVAKSEDSVTTNLRASGRIKYNTGI